MGLFAGLASLAALSLFLAHFLRRSSALMPLLAIAVAMLFFTVAGVAGLLYAAGWVWYALCAAALGFTLLRTRRRFARLLSPGWVLFVLGGLLFIVLYLATGPMLTHWDEFTFWGTAGKVTSETHQLYTTARSSLIARSYPPGLIVYSYMMQFFGGFTEPGFIAAFAILYLACFSAATALWGRQRTAAVLFFAALFLLPFFFETNRPAGQMMWSYLLCMADMPMAFFFGGALCFYFAGGEKGGRLLLPFGLILAALTNLKDMGLALALIALMVAAADLIFCERDRLSVFRLRRWKGVWATVGGCLVLVVGVYLLWALHLRSPQVGINRFDLGSSGQSLPMPAMLLAGFKALFGIQPSAQFSAIWPKMLDALFTRPVTLLGPGILLLALILVLSALAWLFSPTRRQRRRVLVFTLAMALGFAAFYLFNIFTYAFIFQPVEALELKDYARYIAPLWVGWLLGALVLLTAAATHPRSVYLRQRGARAAAGAVSLLLIAAVLVRGNWRGNFLTISPSHYTVRHSVAAVAEAARAQGMRAEDTVYILSQGDDGTRFYMFGFELEAVRTPVYFGPALADDGSPLLADNGAPVYRGNAAVRLADATDDGDRVACTPEQLAAYLRQEHCTHLLVDEVDDFIYAHFTPLFEDGLAGWTDDDSLGRGHRYYRVTFGEDGSCLLVPETGGDP